MRRAPIIVGVIGAVLLGAVGAVPAIGSGGHSIPDVQKLFSQALARVHAAGHGTFARAAVYEADGSTRAGNAVRSAAGIVSWRFVLDNPTHGSPYAYATITYGPAPKAFGAVVGHTMPFLEDVPITAAPKISLGRAVTLLRAAGFTAPFDSVTLRDPVGPARTDPSYFFGINGHVVSVDVITGKVARAG